MSLSGLMVGLGNPGPEYAQTRHNFGFLVIDALADHCKKYGRLDNLSSSKEPCMLWRAGLAGLDPWLLMQPLTFMNRSGRVVQRISAFYKLAPESIICIHDDLDLPLGIMRYKRGGSNAGHNGLKSIEEQLGTPDFGRLRLGIGRPSGYDAVSFVMGKFSAKERESLPPIIDAAMHGLISYMKQDNDVEMQQLINSYRLE